MVLPVSGLILLFQAILAIVRREEGVVQAFMRKVEKEDENLKDTFVSVFFVGGFIVALWFAVFSLYLARLRV